MDPNAHLDSMGQRILRSYRGLPGACAAMLSGSVAKGLADFDSDLDLMLYYEAELPDEESLARIRVANGAKERTWVLGERASGSFAEAYPVDGVEVQIVHSTVAAWQAEMDQVLVGLDCESPLQKALEGTLAGRAVFGEEIIEAWQRRAADYPPALAEAMVKKHLAFFPMWGLETQFRTRDATIWYHASLAECAHHVVGILAGLNRLYFTTFQSKRMGRLVAAMKIAPEALGPRLDALFAKDMSEALPALERLVTETVELVERHMPSADTSAVRRRLGWRRRPWGP